MIETLAGALRENRTLTRLNLQNSHLGDHCTQSLVNTLTYNSVLRCLVLASDKAKPNNNSNVPTSRRLLRSQANSENIGPDITDKSIPAIAKMLSINTSLEILDLSNNKLSIGGMSPLFKALETNNTLTSLNLHNNAATPECHIARQ